MKITVHMSGRYKEVGFHDSEDDERTAYTGLLDEEEAADLAEQLQGVARRLTRATVSDETQFLLPLGERAA
jgi:hypothetical protein